MLFNLKISLYALKYECKNSRKYFMLIEEKMSCSFVFIINKALKKQIYGAIIIINFIVSERRKYALQT